MTDRPDGQRSPSHQRVFSLLGFPPASRILAESCRDGLYLALVESPDGSQADGVLLGSVDGGWSRLAEVASRDVARAVGCDPSRAGSTLRIVVNDKAFEEPVSPGGWWVFVARVHDHHLPENAIRLPGPAGPPSCEAESATSEPDSAGAVVAQAGSSAAAYDLTVIEGVPMTSRADS
jgi:hypothetical protein